MTGFIIGSIVGFIIGGIFGFVICAVIAASKDDINQNKKQEKDK